MANVLITKPIAIYLRNYNNTFIFFYIYIKTTRRIIVSVEFIFHAFSQLFERFTENTVNGLLLFSLGIFTRFLCLARVYVLHAICSTLIVVSSCLVFRRRFAFWFVIKRAYTPVRGHTVLYGFFYTGPSLCTPPSTLNAVAHFLSAI